MHEEEGKTGATPDAVLRKVAWRLIPFIMLLYFVAYLDRVNVGFAALTMNADLGFTATVFGTGAGIFFLGYVLFEVPSNIALEKFGARRWIARIMFTWGIISCAMAFVQGEVSFYIARFMLGAAEAGFFPGMILYLTYWFPASQRARIIGTFFIAVPFSNVIGAPLSTALMGIEGVGLRGWQWMFLLEGAPAILLAFVVLRYLTDRPGDAHWLSAEEKGVLIKALEAEQPSAVAPVARTLKQGLLNPRIWLFGAIYFGITVGIYGLGFWLPQILQGFGNLSRGEIGLIAAIPYAVASAVMFFWSRHSDRTRERVWHVAMPAFMAGVGFVVAALLLSTPLLAFVGLILAASGVFAVVPAFWTLPLSVLGGAAAAGGIALVNSIGNLGGYLGPFIVGYFRDASQSYATGLLAMAGFITMTGLLALVAGRLQAKAVTAP
jgi:ACS family tartrate transporter-like MFS transporter